MQLQEPPLWDFCNKISATLHFGLDTENYKVFETIAVWHLIAANLLHLIYILWIYILIKYALALTQLYLNL